MGQPGPATIRCTSCGFSSETGCQKCPNCGSAVVKICRQCGFANPINNSNCDNCGMDINMPLDSGAHEPMATFARVNVTLPPGPPLPPGMPAPGPQAPFSSPGPQQDFFRGLQQPVVKPGVSFAFKADDRREPVSKSDSGRGSSLNRLSEKFRLALAAAWWRVLSLVQKAGKRKYPVYLVPSGLLVLLVLALVWPRPPEVVLVERVKAFVESASSGRSERAHSFLTKASAQDASMSDFAAALKAHYHEKRIYREFKAEEFDDKRGVVSYMYKAGDGPWRGESEYMVKEDGKWRRPFAWHLYPQLDAALKSSPTQAAMLLQKMRSLDPQDVRLSGYACHVSFALGNFKQAVADCHAAVQDSIRIPFLYTEAEGLLLRFKLADAYMQNKQITEALKEYTGILVETQDLSNNYSCMVSQQLVQGYVRVGNYDAALNESLTAQEPCASAGKKKEIQEYIYKMCGNFPDEAIAIARDFKPGGGQVSYQDNWEREREKARQDYGLKRAPEGVWTAQRVAGPYYRVQLFVPRPRRSAPELLRYDLVVNILSGRVAKFPAQQPAAQDSKGGVQK